MKIAQLQDMFRGWFVGDFEPNVLRSKECEVGVKLYKKGDKEDWHYHKISTEITVIATGRVKMFDQIFEEGSIITVEPNDGTSFEALEDTTTVVVKVPSSINDKYTDRPEGK